MEKLRHIRFTVALVAILATLPAVAQRAADGYPSKPVQIVVPFASGGPTDLEARLYAQKLTDSFGKPFLLDFRPGNGGIIGTTHVLKSAPDGHTLLAAAGSFTAAAVTEKNLPFDPIKDFAPISLLGKRPFLISATVSFPAKTGREYIAYAKAHPGEVNFATLGRGSGIHLASVWLHSAANVDVTFITYQGVSQSIPDLISGRAHLAFIPPAIGMPLVKSGRVKVVAVTGLERLPALPDVPTLAESGLQGYEYVTWLGILATGGTPLSIVNRLNAELVKAAKSPEIAQVMAADGAGIVVGSSPGQLEQHLVNEITRWRKVILEAKITLD